MTTSLAAQLKKLSVPDAQVSLSTDYTQASYLFDSKEAAKYDKQYFYNIGVNGLQQLIAKDERFIEFESTLFSPSSQSIQRLMQSSDVNKQLDDTITKFLILLSPYMQLREAHKAIEWLVNRFNIHLRNVDAFMMCLLPFHDQEPFIMALRLLNMDSKQCSQWRWLGPIKNADTYLPQKTLVAHCRTAKGFMGFMCNMLSKHIEINRNSDGDPSAKHLGRVISFFTKTVIGALMSGPPSESTISILIPALSAGFKTKSLQDYSVSSYMIFSQLLTSCTIADSLLSSMLNMICKNVDTELLPNAISVIVLMFQRQNISKVSKKALKYLCRKPTLSSILSNLDYNVKTEPFFTPFVSALVLAAFKINAGTRSGDSGTDGEDTPSVTPLSLLMDVLTTVPLEKKTIAIIIRAVINWFEDNSPSDLAMETDDESCQGDGPFQVFRCLEQRYPAILEATLLDMQESDESGEIKKVIESIQLQSVSMARRDIRSDPQMFMTICLNHHQGSVRKNAVVKLLQDSSEIEDKGSLRTAIIMRLQDEDVDVVSAVLQDPKNLWQLFEEKIELYAALQAKLKVLERSDGRSANLQNKVLQTICCMPEVDGIDSVEASLLIMSYLVPCSSQDMELVENLKSDFAASSSLLKYLQKDWYNEVKKRAKKLEGEKLFSSSTVKLVESVTAFCLQKEPLKQIMSLYEHVSKTPRSGCALMILALVNVSLIDEVKALDIKTALQRLLVSKLEYFTFSQGLVDFTEAQVTASLSIETVVSSCISQLKTSSKVSMEIIPFCMGNLKLSKTPDSLKETKFWQLQDKPGIDSDWLWTQTRLFNFVLELSSNENSYVSALSKRIIPQIFESLGGSSCLMKILCMLWVEKPGKYLTVAHQARSLQFAQVFLQTCGKKERVNITTNENIPVLPSLLVLMSRESEKVRKVSLSLLEILSDTSKAENFKWFATNLMVYQQEIENDVSFLPQVFKNMLEDDSSLEPPAAKRRKSTGSQVSLSSKGLNYLMDILVDPATPFTVKLGLLNAFGQLNSVKSFDPLMGYLKSLLDKAPLCETPQEKASLKTSIRLLLLHITPGVAESVTAESNSLKVIQQALSCPDMVLATGESVQMLTAKQLSRRFMSTLPKDSCQIIFSQLLDIMTSSHITAMVRACRRIIKHMKLHFKLVLTELNNVLLTSLAPTIRQTKKQSSQASSSQQQADVLESKQWKRITTLLEIVHNKKTIIDAVHLVTVAFQVLGRVLELEQKGSGEYIKQLLLGTIYKICSQTRGGEDANAGEGNESIVTGEQLNMELIVQCIRSSDNAHTHHQALLLLSVTAKIDPNLLLHNMMSVFTFMGANILRQDDEYSFQVIERILENVIPAIKTACEEKNKGEKRKKIKKTQNAAMMTVVLRVFVDAIPHIPSHRKIMLFQKLLTVVGVDTYSWRVLLLVVENVVQRSKAGTLEGDDSRPSGPVPITDLEFLSSICETFTSLQYFKCITGAVGYLMQLPDDNGDAVGSKTVKTPQAEAIHQLADMTQDEMEIFSVHNHSAKQLRHFKYGAVYVLAQLMKNQQLIAQLSSEDPQDFLANYQTMVEVVLQFIGQVTKTHDQHQQDSSGRFWKIYLHKCHDLLDNMVNLLPDSMFLKVVSGLMEHSLAMVQKRSMDLLNTKLQYYKDNGIYGHQREMLLELVSKLEVIVTQTLFAANYKDEDVVNGQTAIYGLKVLCRILGEASLDRFLNVLQLCIKALAQHETNGTVAASAMLCLAEVVSCAKVHAIEHLKELMPLVLHQLQMPTICGHEVLLLAAITSLQKIIEAVPLFLSPYLSDIIFQICIISSQVHTESHKPVVLQKIKLISSTIAKLTATRTFLPVLKKTFTKLHDRLGDCAECLMVMLKDHIEHISRDDMSTFCQDLLKFFLECFETRSERTDLTISEMDSIEGFMNEAFIALVFKLSEVQFKPMLLQFYSWATDMDASKDRVLTFYRLCSCLAEKLKNLFTLFAGHILKHSCDVLDANNKAKGGKGYFGKGQLSKKKSRHLVEHILSCLQKTFMHDTEGFMNKERFDIVMQPIVDQLENNLGKPDIVDKRAEIYLVPCLASLAAAARDDSLWKDMNYQILLKTRNADSKVRMRALAAIDAFHKQLGEDYTQLVPEAIPFIAELMEDESDEVEKYTQKVIAAMEISVGENLQEYF